MLLKHAYKEAVMNKLTTVLSLIRIILYRTLATAIVLAPIVINILLEGNIVSSLLYTPLLSIIFLGVAIVLDSKLTNIPSAHLPLLPCCLAKVTSSAKAPAANEQLPQGANINKKLTHAA